MRGSVTLLLAAIAALTSGFAWLQTDAGGRWLADRIEVVASTPERQLTIGRLGGVIPFAPRLTNVRLADAAGPWLTLDSAAFRLHPLALLRAEARFEAIEAGRIAILRQPAAGDADAQDGGLGVPALPRLPLRVTVEQLAIAEIALGDAVPGGPARFRVLGSAWLADPREGLSLDLSVVRADGSRGGLETQVRFLPKAQHLTAAVRLHEGAGGLIAGLTGWSLPSGISVDFRGQGDLADWTGKLRVDGGADLQIGADLAIAAEGRSQRVSVDAVGRLAGLVSDAFRPLVDGASSLGASILVKQGEPLQVDHLAVAGGFGVASATGRLDLSGDATNLIMTGVPAGAEPFANLTGGVSWNALALSAVVTGSLRQPVLSGALSAERLAHGDRAVKALRTGIEMRFGDRLSAGEARVSVNAKLGADELDLGAGASLALTEPWVELALSLGADGAADVEKLQISSSGVAMSASGRVDSDQLALDWRATVADLSVAHPSLKGGLMANGRLDGRVDDPAIQARVNVHEVQLFDRPVVSGGQLDASLAQLGTGPTGDLALTAILAGLPLRANARLQGGPDFAAVQIHDLTAELASLTASGELALESGRIEGALSARVAALEDLAPLIGETVSGQIDASLVLSVREGAQMADAVMTAHDLSLSGAFSSVRSRLTLQLNDLLGTVGIAARLEAESTSAAALALERGVLTAEGGTDGLLMAVELVGKQLNIEAQAEVAFTGRHTAIELAALRARYGDVQASLAGPARLKLEPGRLLIDELVVRAEGGQLSVDGHYGASSDIEILVTDAPLALAQIALPNLEASGRVNGRLRLLGTRQAPRASAELRAIDVELAQLRAVGLSALNIQTTMNWEGGQMRLSAAVEGDAGSALTASATLAAPPDGASGLPTIDMGGRLSGELSGRTRLGVLNDAFAARGDRIDGGLSIALAMTGTAEAPWLAGFVEVSDGSLRSPLAGLSLDDINLRLVAEGDRLNLAQLSAEAPNGGQLQGGGTLGMDASAGFPMDLSLRFHDALLIDSEIVSVEIQGELAISGSLAESAVLAGRLTVVEAEIRLPDRLPPSIQTLEVVEINVPPHLQARRPEPRSGQASSAPSLPIELDLRIDSPGRIFVRGQGLDAEVAGNVRVLGRPDAATGRGGFELRRGTFTLLGKRFELDEGVVTLPEDGSLDADIRFVALSNMRNGEARVTVAGRASAPRIQIESTPELPEDEILAQLLFGRDASSLSALETIQLAGAALQLTGVDLGSGGLDGLGGIPGADQLRFRQGDGERGVGLRGRIAEGIDVAIERGLKAGSGRATVDLDVLPNVSVETDFGVNNPGRVGIEMEWEY